MLPKRLLEAVATGTKAVMEGYAAGVIEGKEQEIHLRSSSHGKTFGGQRVSEAERAGLERLARSNWGASMALAHQYHDSQILGLCLDLKDARDRCVRLEATLRVIGYEPIGDPEASVVTIYKDIVDIARAAIADPETTIGRVGPR